MVRGRKPTPVALKLVEGNPGKRKLPAAPSKPAAKRGPGRPKDAVTMPKGLSAKEKATWRSLVSNAPPGVLTRADENLILQYVRAKRIYDEADQAIQEAPSLFRKWGQGLRAHPAIKVMNDQSDRMTRILSELGFSPTARARLGIGIDDGEEERDETEDKFFR